MYRSQLATVASTYFLCYARTLSICLLLQGDGTLLSEESKAVAHSIENHLEFGATFGAAVKTREEADALLDIYKSERYLLSQHDDRLLVFPVKFMTDLIFVREDFNQDLGLYMLDIWDRLS